ncbi:MAG: cytochrome P450 [Acidimicrobiia bacterium]
MSGGITPPPPVADVVMPWDAAVADPVVAIAAARDRTGDTFVVHGADTEYLFLFSPAGVRSFYALAESDASKGIADWQMLRRKLPDELFVGRRTFPHDLFARDDVAQYRDVVAHAVGQTLAEMGPGGTVDAFDLTRRLGHRIGLATWAGPCGDPGPRFEELVDALDRLDGAAAFVDPGAMAAVTANGKAAEHAALAAAEAVVRDAIGARDADPAPPADHFQRIVDAWTGEPGREQGIARDVVLVHLGSMSNLFAALGWLLVDVLRHPELLDAVRAGDTDLAERCAMESIRIAQRSIMMRAVLRRCTVADEHHTYTVDRGVTVATLLPITNCPAGTDLAIFDPDRWSRRRLRADRLPAARELVTTFGHGPHTCPAQPYSLHVMTTALTAVLDGYDVALADHDPVPRRAQIGGIARPEHPCAITYRRR